MFCFLLPPFKKGGAKIATREKISGILKLTSAPIFDSRCIENRNTGLVRVEYRQIFSDCREKTKDIKIPHPTFSHSPTLKPRPTACPTMASRPSITALILASQTQEAQSLLDRGTSTSRLVCRLLSVLCVNSQDITRCSFPHRCGRLRHLGILPRHRSRTPIS